VAADRRCIQAAAFGEAGRNHRRQALRKSISERQPQKPVVLFIEYDLCVERGLDHVEGDFVGR
jgi:hypothetical protein